MVLGNLTFNSFGDLILGLFPITGLYKTGFGVFLSVLVAIELIRYIWYARPPTGEEHSERVMKIGNIPMYILTAMFFGWIVVGFVLIYHKLVLINHSYKSYGGAEKENAEEEQFPYAPTRFDINLLLITTLLAVLLSSFPNLPLWFDDMALSLPGNLKYLAFIVSLGILIWANASFLETKDPRKESLGKLITMIIFFLGFGLNGLNFYLVYVVVSPWIHYIKPIHKIGRDPFGSVGSGLGYGVERIANAPSWANKIVQQSADFSTNLMGFLKTNLRIKSKGEREKEREESFRENALKRRDRQLATENEEENEKIRGQSQRRTQGVVDELEEEIEESEQAEERNASNLFLSELKLDKQLNSKIPHHYILTFFVVFFADILDFMGFASPANIFGWIIDGIAVAFLLKNVAKSPISQLFMLALLPLEFYFLGMNINLMIYFVLVLFIEHFSNKELITFRKKERKAGKGGVYVEWKPVIWSVAILVIVIVALPYSGINFNKIIVESREMIRITAQEGIRLQIRFAEENPIEAIISGWKNLWAQATNPYYGVVDGSQKRDLGGKFTRFKSDPIIVAPGENALVTASLKLELLDDDLCVKNPKDPFCKVQLLCEIDKHGSGKVTPKYLNVLDIKSGEIVTCEYAPTKEGLFIYNLLAKYNFETLAYLPIYFVDDEELTNQRKNKDFVLDTYLSSKGLNPNPIAKFSPGPFYVGISTSEGSMIRVKKGGLENENIAQSSSATGTSGGAVFDITGLAIGDLYGSPLGISIGNHWTGGEIQEITNLSIIVDENLRLDECSTQMKQEKVEKGERYYVNDKSPAIGKIEKFKAITCRLKNADLNNPGAVLRGRPIIQSDVKVQVIGKYISKLGIGVKAEGLPVEKKFKKNEFEYLDICEDYVTTCSNYEDSSNSVEYCNRNPCKAKIGNGCYWDTELGGVDAFLIDRCKFCPQQGGSCNIYESESTCAYDGCSLGCKWNTERESCVVRDVEKSFVSFVQDNNIYVDKCFGKKVQIKNEFKHDILAPHNGFVAVNNDLKRLVITDTKGYTSTFEGIENYFRINGNVYPGQLVGISDKFNYSLKKNNVELDIFKFYNEQSPPIKIGRGENCEEEKTEANNENQTAAK